jgi:hypothetical protein
VTSAAARSTVSQISAFGTDTAVFSLGVGLESRVVESEAVARDIAPMTKQKSTTRTDFAIHILSCFLCSVVIAQQGLLVQRYAVDASVIP